MTTFYIIAAFLSSCIFKREGNMVNITINPSNYGWYFIELNKDSLINDPYVTNVKFDSTSRLQSITVSGYDKFDYRVFDSLGTDISSRMRLSGILSHHSGKTFFKFYNPTEQELSLIKKWLSTDPNYREIKNGYEKQLEKLLQE